MNILLIEDDSFKADSLQSFLVEHLSNLDLVLAPSLVDAIEALEANKYSLILLDMAIPSHPTNPGEGAPMSLLTGGARSSDGNTVHGSSRSLCNYHSIP